MSANHGVNITQIGICQNCALLVPSEPCCYTFKMFKKIAFVGLGLIGGSLAQAVNKACPKTEIIALTRSRETVNYALRQKIISGGSAERQKFATMLKGVDLLIVAAPVNKIVESVKEFYPLLSEKAIILDVGSCKREICQNLSELSDKFIGGHPMFGTEETGIKNADRRLVTNAVFVLTPDSKTSHVKINKLKKFIGKLKMRPLLMSADRHDQAVAAISHVPYLTAVALLRLAETTDKKTLAATGFQSSTRVGGADPQWGAEICRINKQAIGQELNVLIKNLKNLRRDIKKNKTAKLLSFFKESRAIRRSIYQ